jgi:hypothetical protein
MKRTPSKAIADKCKDCIYDESNGGTWREQTENCTVTKCPLYEHRPISLGAKKAISNEKFNALSDDEKEAEITRRKQIGERLQKNKLR